jgi:Cupin superfamily protein
MVARVQPVAKHPRVLGRPVHRVATPSLLSTQAPAARLLEVPAGEFADAFGRSPFRVRHRLDAQHALLTRDALIARAADWPTPWLEHHRADLPFVLPTGETDQLAVNAGEVVRDIDSNGCWVVLWDLEHSPSYSQFLDECLEGVDTMVGDREGGLTSRGLNVLVASPGAVVPAHFDLNHNFLLQIEGTKDVMIGSFSDPSIGEREIDRYFDEHNNNARILPDVVSTFRLAPGDGLYIPPYAFHWVRGGSDASIGISCGFRTRLTEQTNLVHICNAKLRRIGLHPAAPGRSAHRDRAKIATLTWARRVRRTITSAASRVRRWIHRSPQDGP